MLKYLLYILCFIIISCGDDTATNNSNNNNNNLCGKMPIGLVNSDSLRIIALMPNPIGSDDLSEYFILKNFGNSPILLSNYYIKDKDSVKWNFEDISINQCDTFKLLSDKVAQLLNSGDEVTLFNSSNVPIQIVNYPLVQDGVLIRFDK